MATYWIVVRRGNPELHEALRVAFRATPGFTVLLDRRRADERLRRATNERREAPIAWGSDEFIVAERLEPAGAAA